jgi:hypothetical protein
MFALCFGDVWCLHAAHNVSSGFSWCVHGRHAGHDYWPYRSARCNREVRPERKLFLPCSKAFSRCDLSSTAALTSGCAAGFLQTFEVWINSQTFTFRSANLVATS